MNKPHGNTGNKHAVGHGRPRLSPQGRIGKQISGSPEQHAELARRAAAAGQTISGYVWSTLGIER